MGKLNNLTRRITARAGSSRRSRLRVIARSPWRAGLVSACAAVAMIALFIGMGEVSVGVRAASAAGPTLPTHWQSYRDPAGYFALQIPAGWQVATTGGGSFVTMVKAPHMELSGLEFHITVYPYGTTPYAKTQVCAWYNAASRAETIEASSTKPRAEFANSRALYVVDYWFASQAGTGMLLKHPLPPVPQDVAQAAQRVFVHAMATFDVLPAAPPAC